jgi:antitoxin PrlF
MTSAYSLDFVVNAEGGIVIRKVGSEPDRNRDRFDAARGTADVKWRTDDLMALLRSEA